MLKNKTFFLLKQKAFILEMISIFLLFLGVALNYWNVTSTLFFFNCEMALLILLAIINSFGHSSKSQPGPMLFGGLIILLGTLAATYLISVSIGEYIPTSNRSENNFNIFTSQQLLNLWPILTILIVSSIFRLLQLGKKEKEGHLISKLFFTIFSLLFISIIGGWAISKIHSNYQLVMAFILIIVRLGLELYVYRSVFNWKTTKQKKQP
ncbi:MAG: hypothetical protein ACI857_002926 [Arenicella sp.]|jgi:hypothetical protein